MRKNIIALFLIVICAIVYTGTIKRVSADTPLPTPTTDLFRQGQPKGPPAYNQMLMWKYWSATQLGGSTAIMSPVVTTIDYSAGGLLKSSTIYSLSSSTEADIAYTQYMLMIDMSEGDTGAWPHGDTLGEVVLVDIDVNARMSSKLGVYKVSVGVIETQDGNTSAKVAWFWNKYIGYGVDNLDGDSVDQFVEPTALVRRPWIHEKNLAIDGETVGKYIAIGTRDAANTGLAANDPIGNIFAAEAYAAPRDIVIGFTEVVPGGKVTECSFEAEYRIVPK